MLHCQVSYKSLLQNQLLTLLIFTLDFPLQCTQHYKQASTEHITCHLLCHTSLGVIYALWDLGITNFCSRSCPTDALVQLFDVFTQSHIPNLTEIMPLGWFFFRCLDANWIWDEKRHWTETANSSSGFECCFVKSYTRLSSHY